VDVGRFGFVREGFGVRALLGLVIGMGALIVAGVVVIGVTVVHRMSAAIPPVAAASRPVTLDEPAGSHIVQAAEAGGRLTAVLQGGGPDRVLVVDLGSGRVVARVALAR
jgi:hypothetical protein